MSLTDRIQETQILLSVNRLLVSVEETSEPEAGKELLKT